MSVDIYKANNKSPENKVNRAVPFIFYLFNIFLLPRYTNY